MATVATRRKKNLLTQAGLLMEGDFTQTPAGWILSVNGIYRHLRKTPVTLNEFIQEKKEGADLNRTLP